MFVKTPLFENLLKLETPNELQDSKEAIRRGILFTEENVYLVFYEDTLDTLHEMIDCRCIDIVQRYIMGLPVDIVLDDEGLLKEDKLVTAVATDEREIFVGNLLICGHDDSENLADVPVSIFQTLGSCVAGSAGLDPRLANWILRHEVYPPKVGDKSKD